MNGDDLYLLMVTDYSPGEEWKVIVGVFSTKDRALSAKDKYFADNKLSKSNPYSIEHLSLDDITSIL